MADPEQQNLNNAQTEPVKEEPTATEPEKTGGKTFTEAEVEQLIKDRLAREKAAAEKKASEAARKAAEEAAAKNGEWEKVAKQRETELAELQAQVKQRELRDLKVSIGAEVGLIPSVAELLTGETPEEIKAKAKTIFDDLQKKAAAQVNPGAANPNSTARTGETDAQRRQRLGLR